MLKPHDFRLVNLDTDSISFCKKDGSEFTEEEQVSLIDEINSNLPELINFSHDGYFKKLIVVKAKNYILFKKYTLKDGKLVLNPKDTLKLKGSGMKSSRIEPFLKEFMKELIDTLIENRQSDILDIYNKYIKSVFTITDIKPYSSKRTISPATLASKRPQETKIMDAIAGIHHQMGDKVYLYITADDKLKLVENWNNDHNPIKLCERIYKILKYFELIIDLSTFPMYHKKTKGMKKLIDLGITHKC
jgi:DNA polymerase elongation subunit (family B)